MSIEKTFPASEDENKEYKKMFYIDQTKDARKSISYYLAIPAFFLLLIELLYSNQHDLFFFLIAVLIAFSLILGFFSLVNNKTIFLFRNEAGDVIGSYDIPTNMDALFLKIRVIGPFYKITAIPPTYKYIRKITATLTKTRFLVKMGKKPTVYCKNLEDLYLFIETFINFRRDPENLVKDYIDYVVQTKTNKEEN